mmetsp:Transcript_14402/g.20084  ORF Transcript_14402/g.20084 Transcript_14402/m.20084 type:complete len:251 (+) Transcript_14402:147-899(+)
MSQKQRLPELNTAVQIVKGAAVKVLGDGKPSNLRTVSCQAIKKGEGRLVVEYKKSASAEQLQQIDKLANELIKKNLEVRSFAMAREEAEKKYGIENLYDKIQPPESIKELTIVEIPDWVVNSCLGTHIKNTSEIGSIKVIRQNFRDNKGELEIVFEVTESSNSNASSSDAKKPVPQKAQLNPYDDVHHVSKLILDEMLRELKNLNVDVSKVEKQLVASLEPKIAAKVNTTKNIAFTNGMNAHKVEHSSML